MLTFTTPLSIENCIEIIDQSVKSKNKEVYYLHGKVKQYKFYLYYRAYINNSFNRVFYGKLSAKRMETIIQGKFKLAKTVKAFLIIWNAGLAFMALLTNFDFIKYYNQWGEDLFDRRVFFAVPVMYALEVLMLVIGRLLSKNNEKEVIQFISKNLMASSTEWDN